MDLLSPIGMPPTVPIPAVEWYHSARGIRDWRNESWTIKLLWKDSAAPVSTIH